MGAMPRESFATSPGIFKDVSGDQREDGPLAFDVPPKFPTHPRPETRTITTTTAEYGRLRLTRVGLDLNDVIEEEMEDYRAGLRLTADDDAVNYAARQPDVAFWEGERCLAVLRPRVGGEPEVTRFDGEDGDWPSPFPSTEGERAVWTLVKQYDPDKVRVAILEKLSPGYGGRENPETLAPAEQTVVRLARALGGTEAMDRLLLTGPYQPISDAIDRLGSDAVHELRRIVAAGNVVQLDAEKGGVL